MHFSTNLGAEKMAKKETEKKQKNESTAEKVGSFILKNRIIFLNILINLPVPAIIGWDSPYIVAIPSGAIATEPPFLKTFITAFIDSGSCVNCFLGKIFAALKFPERWDLKNSL